MTTATIDRIKAEDVVDALNDKDANARLFWDRGPYCVQLFLNPDETTEYSPSLLFCVEDSDEYKIADGRGWEWSGSLFPDEDGELGDVSFHILERTWLGDGADKVADDMIRLRDLLA